MKRRIGDLCLFGGPKTFSHPRHVGKPNPVNRKRFMDRVERILDSGLYTNSGPFAREFEQRLAAFIGARHCIVTCNGTTALQIAARALDLKGEVIVPSFTFPATAHALQWQNITPVFCDIEPNSCTIDPTDIARRITPNTSAIVGVHLFGRACRIERLTEIAARNNLRLMFDACHAFGCSYHGTMIGNYGDAEIFSFHATKFINSFEGGAIATNNDDLADRLRLMRNFGSNDLVNILSVGTNGKISEIAAAMGLTSLEEIEQVTKTNRINHNHYEQQFSSIPGLALLTHSKGEHNNFQYVVARLDKSRATIRRDNLFRLLRKENILVQRYFYPGTHNVLPYRNATSEATRALPITDEMVEQLLVFPTGLNISKTDIERIGSVVRFIFDHGTEIERRLAGERYRKAEMTANTDAARPRTPSHRLGH